MRIYLSKRHQAFDPETLVLLSGALDEAWKHIQENGCLFEGRDEDARDMLAKHIVNLALLGERDHQRLVDGALERYKL